MRAALAALALGFLAGCAQAPGESGAGGGVADMMARPGERALADGLRAYEEGAFERAERHFRAALVHGLQNPRDTAAAHKNLAFIDCAFNRLAECEGEFRAAFAADPQFHLSDAEIGHPVWGPVYRRVVEARAPLLPDRQ